MKRKNSSILLIMLFISIDVLLSIGTLLGNIVSDSLKSLIKPYVAYTFPVFIIVIVLGICLTILRHNIETTPEVFSPAEDAQNSQRLLEKVNAFWIRGVLDQSLYGVTRVALMLSEQRNAVKNPWGLSFQHKSQATRVLPAGTSITSVYDDSGGELLILGEPGSGKSTLLLELARDLLNRARENPELPIPVVFNLSSWPMKRRPIAEWIVQELHMKYQVPLKIGQRWIQQNKILLLLDGLDEISQAHMAACIAAINVYRKEHGFAKVVVCSRFEEYVAQTDQLWLNNAVKILPLTKEQIDYYVANADNQSTLSLLLRNNQMLGELMKSPLTLGLLSRAYQMCLPGELPAGNSPALLKQVLTIYVQHMLFQHRERKDLYKPEQVTLYLRWLARQLKWHNQNQLYIEHIQIDWLTENRLHRLYPAFVIGIVYGLFCGIGNAMAYLPYLTLEKDILAALLIGAFNTLLYGLLNGVILGLFASSTREYATLDARVHEPVTQKVIAFLGNRLSYGLLNGLLNGLFVGLLVGPVSGWICGLFTCCACTALGKLELEIKPAEAIKWSWSSMWQNLSKFLAGGALVGLIYGLVNGRSYLAIPEKLFPSLLFGLSIGLLVGLIVGVKGGFSNEQLDDCNILKPNQGIRNSARHSILFGLFFGVTFGLVFGILYGPALYLILGEEYRSSFPANSGLIYGLSDGIIVAAFFWLLSGGIAVIQHALLRVGLWKAGYIPWNYVRFLNFAAERLLLQRVGGGYMFIHSLLQDYYLNKVENTLEEDVPPPSQQELAQEQLCSSCGSRRRPHALYCHCCGVKFKTDPLELTAS